MTNSYYDTLLDFLHDGVSYEKAILFEPIWSTYVTWRYASMRFDDITERSRDV